MSGFMVDLVSTYGTHSGYLAPSVSGMGPGVIVLQEWWGLVGHIKSVADRFAEEGFTALAPDLYEGKSTTEPDEAGSLMMALNIERTAKMLEAAIEELLARPECSSERVGVVGFCMGGQLSLFTACMSPKIAACVDYYGIHPNVHPQLDRLQAPLLGFFAEHDSYASPEAVRKLSEQLDSESKKFEFVTYEGCHHAFFNDSRPAVYDPAAATDSWNRMVQFFRKNVV